MASAKLETAKFSALGILGYTGTLLGRELKYWQDIEDGTSGTGQIENLTPTDGNFIVGNGTAWVAESGATVRSSLGLGTGDSPTFAGLGIGISAASASKDFVVQGSQGASVIGTGTSIYSYWNHTLSGSTYTRGAIGINYANFAFQVKAQGTYSLDLVNTQGLGLTIANSTGAATFSSVVVLASYTVATLPIASSYTGGLIYVSDETGGATVAYSNGTNWLRVYDAATVS